MGETPDTSAAPVPESRYEEDVSLVRAFIDGNGYEVIFDGKERHAVPMRQQPVADAFMRIVRLASVHVGSLRATAEAARAGEADD